MTAPWCWSGHLSDWSLGVPLVWLVSRSDISPARLIRLAMTGSLIIPPFLAALACILLAGPNAGLLNQVARLILGTQHGPFNVFSIGGLIFVVGLNSASVVFLLVAGALDALATEVEDASRIFGAGPAETTRRVTLPLVLPTIVAALSLSFAEAITLFGTPAMIGLPARLPLLTTQLWALFQFPPRLDLAAALAVPFLLSVALLLGFQRVLLGSRRLCHRHRQGRCAGVWILFIAYLTKLFPVAFSSGAASLKSVAPELEEAARIGGADRLAVFRTIALPLMRPGLTTAWVLIFIAALRELSASVLLFTSNSRVIPVAIYDLDESGRFEQTAVLAVVLLVLTFGVLAVVRRVGSFGSSVRMQG